MNTITVSQAEANLRKVIQQVLDDVEPTIVTTESGDSVVILSLDEYNAWQETLYLLSTPANAEHLRRSIAEDKAGYAMLGPTE
ncbi:MAG: type II toxin-antitoxin system prevent-host-death family antitoxin [Chloroflexi bacterium]|nr:type II toxin-antitoxin system prevent-host-death family antitoxin [Chloroflexota bacterium]MCI0575514.1 type II toxin-antitoxin system prevent-host-death family antitoxin [Chloroflexota bacterium]MCI0644291.1 type II toxin-antitoxin system prevent-host-death family antitoxin [Chloroflexota bacterium]MCI0726274.1 type II toxin-antitoxin system prevent-host-death family antitoxin [Chloroflexota bacterium]